MSSEERMEKNHMNEVTLHSVALCKYNNYKFSKFKHESFRFFPLFLAGGQIRSRFQYVFFIIQVTEKNIY